MTVDNFFDTILSNFLKKLSTGDFLRSIF